MSDLVFEIIMDDWDEFPGNELYASQELAEFFGIQDYENAFYSRWKAGFEDAEQPGEFKWEFIGRWLWHLYEDGSPTGLSMHLRPVHAEAR